MSPTRTKRSTDDVSEPQVPQSTPSSVGMGFHGHDFTLQAVMELQKAVGEINANLNALRSSVDGMKSKVDDLVGWKHKIVGGAAVIAVVGAVLGWAVAKASDYVTIKVPSGAPVLVAPVTPPPIQQAQPQGQPAPKTP